VVSQVAIPLPFLFGLQGRHGPALADEIEKRSESTYENQEPRQHHLDPPRLRQASEASSMRPNNGGRQRMLSATVPTMSRRRANLRNTIGFLRLPPTEPELQLLHRWLDTWTGVGLITVGVERHGMRLSLSHIADGEWRAVFMGRECAAGATGLRCGTDAVAGGAAGGVGGGRQVTFGCCPGLLPRRELVQNR
jgi:hypothetical protein